ncbi:hypothetical protein ACWKSP_26595 [Micromonosporaceae bacterium Da 78-11]
MQLNSEDLLARIRREFPAEYEIAQLRELTELQAAEIERLTALTQPATSYTGSVARPYSIEEEGRHG